MKRTKLKDRVLPKYTKGEEIFNMTTHIVGGAFALIAMIICIGISVNHRNVYGIITSIIYGISMITLYTMSSIYHGLSPKITGKKVMQVLDHCTIFVLIAVIWATAVLGIILNSIDLRRYRVFSMICYIGMGWIIILKANLLPLLLGKNGVILLVSGGIVYTIGAILYGIGVKHKYIHSIFHIFIVLGSVLQFLCIALYVL